jgi:hypothetical protein
MNSRHTDPRPISHLSLSQPHLNPHPPHLHTQFNLKILGQPALRPITAQGHTPDPILEVIAPRHSFSVTHELPENKS